LIEITKPPKPLSALKPQIYPDGSDVDLKWSGDRGRAECGYENIEAAVLVRD